MLPPGGTPTRNVAPAAPSQPTQQLPGSGSDLTSLNPANQSDLLKLSSYNPSSGPDPRGPDYWANLAKLLSTSQQDYAGQQLEQTNADLGYQSQSQQMGTDRQQSIRNLAESLIGKGLLRSGYHDRAATEATGNYLTAVNNLQSQKSQGDASRQAKMSAILANLGIDEEGLYANAAQSYAQKQAELAANAAAMGTVPASAYTPPSPKSKDNKKDKKGNVKGGVGPVKKGKK